MRRSLALLAVLLAAPYVSTASAADRPPNVMLIITDDQGYGDIGFNGNTMIKTPHLDALARQSVRLTNFHVDPTCAETRSALMTGRYSCRTGVWHTVAGRSILRGDEVTMGDVFANSGYATGLFGKWHLGEHHPYGPGERGFQEVLRHKGGGVGQIPDAWGNDYFDDRYEHNGELEPQPGYCTDVWFSAASKFIEQNRAKPFFCYVATNAPHDPLNVDDKYVRPYADKGMSPAMARFYGMISNIDENVGRLLAKLDEWKLTDNTIVIFMTDNGTGAGVQGGKNAFTWRGFNAGMRDQKTSQYEGGHRVPCFIRGPRGMVLPDHDVSSLTAHFDLLPTLMELCHLKSPRAVKYDGMSLAPQLANAKAQLVDRTLVVHSQRVEHPEKWRKTAVMTQRWRLVDGKELYDVQSDPGQATNVASDHQDVVAKLTEFYDGWWDDVSTRFSEYVRIPLGAKEAPVVQLNCHDWHGQAIAYQAHLANNPQANGWWAVDVARAGKYRITLRDRPAEVRKPLTAQRAKLEVNDLTKEMDVAVDAEAVVFDVELAAGRARLQTTLTDAAGKSRGAYFVTVEARD
jgi:arylsulfatase A-like enzyme